MPSINLLPPELGPKRSVLKITKSLKKVSLVLFALLVVLSALTLGYRLYLSRQLDSSLARISSYKTQISALENTEQKLFLVKNRLAYINSIQSGNDNYKKLDQLTVLIASIPTEIIIEKIELKEGESTIKVSAQDSQTVSRLFSYLISSDYSNILLEGLSFNSGVGYSANLVLIQ